MALLARTLMRNLREDKGEILKALEKNGTIKCSIQLIEEPGEILTTCCMEKEKVEKSVNKAVHLLFPGCKATSIKMVDDTINFKIE